MRASFDWLAFFALERKIIISFSDSRSFIGATKKNFCCFSLVGVKQGYLLIIGGASGVVLRQASYGFTAGFTRSIKSQRIHQLRAQMLMLIAASLLMLPMFAQGDFEQQDVCELQSLLHAEISFDSWRNIFRLRSATCL